MTEIKKGSITVLKTNPSPKMIVMDIDKDTSICNCCWFDFKNNVLKKDNFNLKSLKLDKLPLGCIKPENFEIGDVVQLISGSVPMIVDVISENMCSCKWFDKEDTLHKITVFKGDLCMEDKDSQVFK